MNLREILAEECIAVHRTLPDKEAVLREAARLAASSAQLSQMDESAILDGFKQRESLGSTGFGKGVAIPHCRLAGVPRFVIGALTLAEGVDFDALDGNPVRLVVFIVAPEEESTEHIRVLSTVSQVLNDPTVVAELLASQTPQALYEGFLHHAPHKGEELPPGRQGKLLMVFVQEEDLLDRVLQVFSSISSQTTMILEAESPGARLRQMPLFASFWNMENHRFNRLVVSIVSAQMVNETVRRLEQAVGDYRRKPGVLIAVQDLFYLGGTLLP